MKNQKLMTTKNDGKATTYEGGSWVFEEVNMGGRRDGTSASTIAEHLMLVDRTPHRQMR